MPNTSTNGKAKLLTGPVGSTLFRMALPMVAGVLAMMLYNIADTYFVGQLGGDQLAAMGFTFPITHMMSSVALGLMVGASTVLARLIGSGDFGQVQRITTDGLLLSGCVIFVLGGVGILFLDPIFSAMGAQPHLLPYIRQYMVPYLAAVALLAVPMVANGAIRATGDTKVPSLIMITSALVNVVLDPLLIFGPGPFPRLELRGAAYASILSWVFTFSAALLVLGKREHMLTHPFVSVRTILKSWGTILTVAVPIALTNLLVPVAIACLTAMMATFGPYSVAGFGVGARVEALSLIGPFALTAALSPFVGQNFGAGDHARVRAALRAAVLGCWGWGLVACIVLAVSAKWVAAIFTDIPEIQQVIVWYLWVVPWSYGAFATCIQVTTTLNALHRPMLSTLVNLVRMFGLTLPLAYLGSRWFQQPGLFAGIAVSNLVTAVGSVAFIVWILRGYTDLDSAAG